MRALLIFKYQYKGVCGANDAGRQEFHAEIIGYFENKEDYVKNIKGLVKEKLKAYRKGAHISEIRIMRELCRDMFQELDWETDYNE